MGLANIINLINNKSSSSLSDKLSEKINSLGQAREIKTQELTGLSPTDADSGSGWRLEGIDAPETYHNNPDVRNKLYYQYAALNGVDLAKAKEQVDAEALAYKTAKENGQDLGLLYEQYRAQGLMGNDVAPTTYDMYRLGDRAKEFSQSPDNKFTSGKVTTRGNNDPYVRLLVDNPEYTNKALEEGYLIPGSMDAATYKNQVDQMEQARLNDKGLFDTDINKRIMNTLHDSSVATYNQQPKYQTDSSYTSAAKSSLGSVASSVGDWLVDLGLSGAKATHYALNNSIYDGTSQQDARNKFNRGFTDLIKGTAFENSFDVKNGDTTFTGFDEAKKQEYWGYAQSENLKAVSKELSDAWKSGSVTKMGSALASSLFNIDAVREVLAGSVGEIGLAATGVGTAALIGGKANDFVEERMAISGKPPSTEDYLVAATGAVVYGLVNKLTRGNAGIDVIKNSSKSLVDGMSTLGLISTVDFLKDVGKNGLKAYGIEGGEEVIQTLAEQVGTKLGTIKEPELFNENSNAELFTAFGLGGPAGMAMSTAVDAPRKAYQTYKHNKPLNQINTTMDNLSQDELQLVNDELNLTRNTVNADIETNKQAIDILQNTLDDKNITDYSKYANVVINTVSEVAQETVAEVANTLNELKDKIIKDQNGELNLTESDIDPEIGVSNYSIFTNNINSNIESLQAKVDSGTATQNDAQNLNLLNTIKSSLLDPNTDTTTLATYLSKVPKGLQVLSQFLDYSGLKATSASLSQSITSKATETNIKKAINTLKTMNDNFTKDLNLVNYKLDSNVRASKTNQQSISKEIDDTFNASTILNGSTITGINGTSNIKDELNAYDTDTLNKIQEDLNKPENKKHKKANRLQSALTSLLRIRSQALKTEGFNSHMSAGDIYKLTIAKGGNRASALLQAVRTNKMTAEEAEAFTRITEELVATKELSDTAGKNIVNKINNLKVNEPATNTSNTTDSNTSTNNTSSSNTMDTQNVQTKTQTKAKDSKVDDKDNVQSEPSKEKENKANISTDIKEKNDISLKEDTEVVDTTNNEPNTKIAEVSDLVYEEAILDGYEIVSDNKEDIIQLATDSGIMNTLKCK